MQGVGGVVGADHDRHRWPGGPFRGRERGVGEGCRHGRQRRLGLPFGVDEPERPVLDLMPAPPPLVGPREGHGAGGALGEGGAQVHRGDCGLAVEPLADAVGAGLGQQQRLGAGHVLQPPQVGAQVGFAVQVDVEGADVEAAHVEMFGRREVHVGDRRVGRHRLDVGVELAQKALDARVPVPAHDRRRDLVAHRDHQRGRMRGDAAGGGGNGLTHVARERGVVEEGDVLRPRNADHDAQAVARRQVEQRIGRHGVGAHRVEASGRHHREVAVDARKWGELLALAVGRKGAVGHPAHEEAPAVEFKELPLDAECRGHALGIDSQHPILSLRLVPQPGPQGSPGPRAGSRHADYPGGPVRGHGLGNGIKHGRAGSRLPLGGGDRLDRGGGRADQG